MKKTFLTFGLLSLMMVLTSFRAPEIGGSNGQGNTAPRGYSEIGGSNGQGNTAPRG